MSPVPGDDAQRAWQILEALVTESRGDWRRKVSEATGMPFSRYRALKRLRTEPRTLRDLAEEMGADAPATTVLVDDLEARGLVERRPHPEDRRAKLVSLTTAGRRQLAVAERIVDQPPEAFRALPPKDLALLRWVLEKMG
ncbi:MAG: MarR family winged helix-turn-helix transcriptional regulator [Stenotrophobium sp.]